ncbi:MAG: electron transfer flavoprotein subunit alpha/FixB family protein, partial [Elusimicrobia bacterium]|nr:electron transfer flavoprotein subunit alpha/FixB family protein [Elusimicrobiota bacterium]
NAAAAADALSQRGFDRVFLAASPALDALLDEAYARALQAIVDQSQAQTVLLPASTMGRSVAPRLGVLLGSGLASDVTELAADGEKRPVATKPRFGGNLLVKLAVKGKPAVLSVRPMAYPRAEAASAGTVVGVTVDPAAWGLKTRFASFASEESAEVDLGAAEKVVSGGRGLGGPEQFSLIRELARALGAGVGASRATVDAGWIPYKHQVGVTGRTVRPRLYVACGISGQIQHLGGMSASDVIVAINTDKDCPMMKLANFAVHGDLNELIPAIIAAIQKVRGEAPVPAGAK